MEKKQTTLDDFTEKLASASPAPGGGGAAALVGALAAALASMVANLTTGKKKYAEFEPDLQRILAEAERLRTGLLECIEDDERYFLPLAKAYSIPKDALNRDAIMEDALFIACTAPRNIMRLAERTIELHRELVEKGSTIMVSDVGVGVQCARAALIGGSLNIIINIKMMKTPEKVLELRTELDRSLSVYLPMTNEIYAAVLAKID